jgi:hypothetical protein
MICPELSVFSSPACATLFFLKDQTGDTQRVFSRVVEETINGSEAAVKESINRRDDERICFCCWCCSFGDADNEIFSPSSSFRSEEEEEEEEDAKRRKTLPRCLPLLHLAFAVETFSDDTDDNSQEGSV